MGTTLGMLLANVPVIIAGQWIMARIPLRSCTQNGISSIYDAGGGHPCGALWLQ